MDRWQSKVIQCKGGLVLDVDALTQGLTIPGSARTLQNYEPAVEGGYRRISGHQKYDANAITGGSNNPVLGVKVALSGVFACRKTAGGDNRIYYSTGSGWTLVSTAARNGSPTKARFISYAISTPVVIQTDGVNAAWKWDGSTETTINGTGAPTNPKYAAMWRNRLVLSGYSANTSAISISAPNDDTDFTGAGGAIEINVGDVVRGLKSFRDTLYIFCEKSIRKLVGNTSSDFRLEDVAKAIGCLSHDSIQELGGDLVYLASDGFRTIAGTERIGDVELGLISKSIQPLVRRVLNGNFGSVTENVFSSCTIRSKSQYRMFINLGTENDAVGFLGKITDTPATPHGEMEWATLAGILPYCSDSDYVSNQELAVIGHPTDGYVRKLENGNTFDGTNIYAIFRTPDITFEDATVRKVFQKLATYTQVDGDVEFSISLKLDGEQDNILQPATITVSQSGEVPVYGSAVYGTSEYGAITYPVFYRNLIGSGFTGAFQFSSSNDKSPHRIDSFQVQFAPKGRR